LELACSALHLLDRAQRTKVVFTLRGEMLRKVSIVQNFRSGAENGKDFSGDYWFTRVYVNQGGRWITVALRLR
jgi:hypothetical protein